MQAKQIVARVEELVKPLCEQAGVSLWDVEFEKEGGQYMLTVTVDRPEGVNIDQCEQVSRALDPMLDEKEFDDMPSYTLCVSSAGMSRRLKRPEHFQAFMGQTVEVADERHEADRGHTRRLWQRRRNTGSERRADRIRTQRHCRSSTGGRDIRRS